MEAGKEAPNAAQPREDVLIISRLVEFWKQRAKRTVDILEDTFQYTDRLETAYESLHAYADQLLRILSAEDAKEIARLEGELVNWCLAEIAAEHRKAVFDDGCTKDPGDIKNDAELFRMKVDYYRGLERLLEVLGLPSDTSLVAAVKVVEGLKCDGDSAHKLIVEELESGNL